MDLGFKGKTVIVTGACKGIGGGISEVFAQEGANLILDYRSDPEYCESFIQSLRDKYGAEIYGIQADVSKYEDIIRIFDFAEERFGRLDVVVNNAGSGPTTEILDLELDEWNDVLNNNVTGQFLMSREFARRNVAQGKGGHIVNLLSKASVSTTTKGRGCYVTNKHAELGLTRQLAVDLTDKGFIVCGIMPGSVRNSMMRTWTPEQEAARAARCPIGRLTEPIEFGYYVAWLASEKNTTAIGCGVDATAGMLLGF